MRMNILPVSPASTEVDSGWPVPLAFCAAALFVDVDHRQSMVFLFVDISWNFLLLRRRPWWWTPA